MPRRAHPGNTMAEYGFIAALVLVACLAALTMLGSNVNQLFASMLGSGGGGAAVTGPTSTGAGGQATQVGAANGYTMTLNGQAFTLPSVTPPPQTSGGNGSEITAYHASGLSTLASLLEEQNADPALVELIKQLANQGHMIAGSQDSLEQICPPGQICGIVDNFHLANNDLLEQVQAGLSDIHGNKSDFQVLLEKLQAQGDLPPEVLDYINSQAEEIIAIANSYQNTSQLNADPRAPLENPDGDALADSKPIGAETTTVSISGGDSDQTTENANNICQTQPDHASCTQGNAGNSQGNNGSGNG